jgi:hypothetical protein
MRDTVHDNETDSKVCITFFKTFAADTASVEDLTLHELAERVLNTARRAKARLPWLKLAKFGNKRSANRSLRHDLNLEQINGIELDYDDEKIPFDDVLSALQELRICALLYTSPSHAADKPRWRVLCPTSAPQPPALRAKLLAKLNGSLKNKFGMTREQRLASGESFTLSQAYFYGWINTAPKPDHKAVVIDGACIDLRDDLAEHEALGAKSDNDDAPKPTPEQEQHGFEYFLSRIGDGDGLEGFREPLLKASASYVAIHRGHPFDRLKLKKLLRDAIDKAPKKPTRPASDIERYSSDEYLDGIIADAECKFVEVPAIALEDFVYVASKGAYMFLPTRELWPTKSVNTMPSVPLTNKDGSPRLNKKTKEQVFVSASDWLSEHKSVQQITWVPGHPEMIKDKLVVEGSGWIEHKGATTFNMYLPPKLSTDHLPAVSEADVALWLDHVRKIYPDEAEHIVSWLAHRTQHPGVKINHCLLLGGAPGIGKDSILEPIRYAVGCWNFQEISPQSIFSEFNGYMRSVILRISEGRDLGDVNRFALYEHLKTIIATPPETKRVNEKHLREYYLFNVTGVIVTTNYKVGGIYLAADDRRTYVAWSNSVENDFGTDYWNALWRWYYEAEGIGKVAAFLRGCDLSSFNPKASPFRTPAFYEIVASGGAPEENELGDAIERLGDPDALTLAQLLKKAEPDLAEWLADRSNRNTIPHRLEKCGYVRTPNPNNQKQGMWIIKLWEVVAGFGANATWAHVGRRQAVYAKASLSYRDQVVKVRELIKQIEAESEANAMSCGAKTDPKQPPLDL